MTHYYVNGLTGDDANDGLSPTTAWKTLGRTLGSEVQSGDALWLKSDCTYGDPLDLNIPLPDLTPDLLKQWRDEAPCSG